MFSTKYKQIIKGFSLIEVIVTLSLITILTLVVLANYRGGEKRYILQSANQQLISDIRKAQNIALSPGPQFTAGVGIHFDLNKSNSYFFFLDKNKNQKYDGPEERWGEETSFPPKIQMKTILPLTDGRTMDIFFLPPDPTTYINGFFDINNSTTISLEMKDIDIPTRTITIKSNGLIE